MILVVKICFFQFFIQPLKTRSALLTSFLFFSWLLVACTQESELETVRLAGETMGTTYHITLVANQGQSWL
jgi:hypothetical protein